MITENVILDAQVHEYAADGDTTRARKALLAARILTAIGIVSGIVIVVIAIILRVVGNSSGGSSQGQS